MKANAPRLSMPRAISLCLVLGWILAASASAQVSPPNGTPHPLMQFTESDRLQLMAAHLAAPETPAATLSIEPFAASLSLLPSLPYTPAERDQGGCGNCWAWAGTGVMEIANQVQTGTRDRLSVQFINSCNSSRGCCGGGWLEDVAQFYSGTGFVIPWSNTYADWRSGDGSCGTVACGTINTGTRYPLSQVAVQRIATTGVSGAQAIANIKAVLNQNRAVWFGFFMPDANWPLFFSYWDYQPETAVWNNFGCGGFSGHAVLCVGYDDSDPANPYWIMVNSWGAPNGRPNGIFRVAMNINYDCSDLYWQTLDITFSGGPSLVVNSFAINNGAAGTTTRSVTLNNACRGNATQFQASESASFVGAAWQPYATAPTFTLSSGTGTKTVYFKVRNATAESPVVSDTIQLNPAATPEIEVSIDGITLTAGQTAAVDFGGTAVGGAGPTKTFTVRNAGTGTLTLGTVSVPVGFTVTKSLTSSLAAGAQDTFAVRLDTASLGTKSGRINILNNDANQNPFTFPIKGVVSPASPGIAVSWGLVPIGDGQAQSIDFGRVVKELDGPTRVFTVKNTGGQTLTLGSVSVPNGYTLVEGLSGTLAPGQQDTFTIRLDTASSGTKSGQVSFANNVSGQNPFNFSVTGAVLASLSVVYVDDTSTCANPDGSQACPLRTVCDAYTAVLAGGTIRIHAGTYPLCQARLTKRVHLESYGGSALLRLPGGAGETATGNSNPAQQVQFARPTVQADGSIRLQAPVLRGVAYQVFTSTNLVQWELLQEITSGEPALQLSWPDGSNDAQRFFKIVMP